MYNLLIISSKNCVQNLYFSTCCFLNNLTVDYQNSLFAFYKQVSHNSSTVIIKQTPLKKLSFTLFTQTLLLILLIYIKKG